MPVVLEKLNIENFREIKEQDVLFGDKITIIAGRNGTAKSSILGLISQFLSFRNVGDKTNLDYKTILQEDFESEFRNHLKISDTYDSIDKKYKINIKIKNDDTNYYLGATKRSDSNQIRFVLRGNHSRNFTWPSIFLDLKRLTPMAYRNDSSDFKLNISEDDKKDLEEWTRKIIPKIEKSKQITANLPSKDIKSAVVTSENYDVQSASSGEDNLGQILLSLLSFKKLKEQYPDYEGGILLIDELDATLFPKAQTELLDLLIKKARDYKIQIIFTTHSPTLLNYAFERKEQSEKNSRTKNDIVVNYFTNKFGSVENIKYETITDIFNDLEYKTKVSDSRRQIPTYCEDKEALDFLRRIITRENNQKLKYQTKVSMGAEKYISLIDSNIQEFKSRSIIVLDGDKEYKKNNIIILPHELPPDQLVFRYLDGLDPSDNYWKNKIDFNKSILVAMKEYLDIDNNCDFIHGKYVLKDGSRNTEKMRKLFKNFYMSEPIQQLLSTKDCNVFTIFKKDNKKIVEEFNNNLAKVIERVERNIYLS